jgi:hypothetical protein
MHQTSKVDAMIVSRTISKNKCLKLLNEQLYHATQIFLFQKIIKLSYHVGNGKWINKKT